MDVLLERLRKRSDKLSKLERDVLEYILGNPQQIAELAIHELSSKLFVSTATISRTAKKLGFEGYQELKYSIVQFERENANHANFFSPSIDIIEEFERQQLVEIAETRKQLMQTDLIQITKTLRDARTIEIMGVGASYSLALDMSQKLVALGTIATARLDWDELRLISQNMSVDSLAILISQSGETIHMLEYADHLTRNQLPFLAIVGSLNSPLEKMATYTLKTASQSIYINQADMSSRVGMTMLINVLLLSLSNPS